MANPDDFLYEYAIVRYVPRVERQEFINIGLIMLCKRRKWLKGRIHLDAQRIQALRSGCDIESLRRQASIFERTDLPAGELPCEEKYRWLAAEKSAILQVSPSHPGIIPSALVIHDTDTLSAREAIELLDKEFDRLFSELVL